MKKYLLFSVMSVVVLASCNSTRIVSSWRMPDKKVSIGQLKKVLIVAVLNNEASNRRAEDQMALYLAGKAVVSYNYLIDNVKMSQDSIRQKIKKDGFDGAVTMRLVDVDKERIYKPGMVAAYPEFYGSFSAYYYNSWSFFQSPGHYATTKTYTVETNVFSIKEDKIIWTGRTKTTNPNGLKKMTEEIAQALYEKMIQEGFISK